MRYTNPPTAGGRFHLGLPAALLILAVLAAGAGIGRSQTPAEIHVVLVAGQSNAQGMARMRNSTSKAGYPEGVLQLGRQPGNDMALVPASHPLEHHRSRPGHFGPALQFAIDYVAARPDVQLVLVPCAKGRTGFSSEHWGIGNPLYEDAVARTRAVLTQEGARLVAIIWAQGEQDANNPDTTRAAFRQALDAQFAGFRRDISGAEDVPILLGSMVPEFVRQRDGHGIQKVINNTPRRVRNTHVIQGPMVGFKGAQTPDNPRDDDLVHYNADSTRFMGASYARTLLAIQGSD